MKAFKVFVYGTLKRGFPLHHHLRGARYLGRAWLRGFVMYDLGWYPAILPGEGVVSGELYEVDWATLLLLDEVEEEGEEYERRLLSVELEDGRREEAFVYVYRKDLKGQPRVQEGVWQKKVSF